MVVIAMKVLFVTSGAIACNVSSGNTFLNLFGELADTELYSLFTRSEVPDKKIKAAFRIAEAELPRYIFRRDRIGERVTANDQVLDEHAMQLEAVAKRNISPVISSGRSRRGKTATCGHSLRKYSQTLSFPF